jgi:hypothetical protein
MRSRTHSSLRHPDQVRGEAIQGDEGQERRLATSAFGLLAMTFHSNAAHFDVPRPSVSLIASLVSRNSTLRELKNGKPRQIAAHPFVRYGGAPVRR